MHFSEFLKDQEIIKPEKFINQPLVSVIMPTYCRAHDGLLARAIKSVLSQTFGDFEFIIIDDGSIDGSDDIIRDFQKQDNRILYLRHDINSGLPALRVDEGILLARGNYLAFEFDDDEWFPPFLKTVTREAIVENRAFVHCQAEYLLEGREYLTSFPIMQPKYESLMQTNKLANATVLIRRSLFETIGLYNPHVILRRVTDWDLWFRIAYVEPPLLISKVLVRVNGGLPDSLGLRASWFNIEDFLLMNSLFSNMELTAKRILDFDVVSLDKYVEKIPNKKLIDFQNHMILPWLIQHRPQFEQLGFPKQEMSKIPPIEHTKKESFSGSLIMHDKDKSTSTHITWDDIPVGFRIITDSYSMTRERNDGFLPQKSRNLQYVRSLSYDIEVKETSLTSILLAPIIGTNVTKGIISIEIISLDDNYVAGYSVMSIGLINTNSPTEFFFEPPIKQGEYHLRISCKGLNAPFRIYELAKGKVHKPFIVNKYLYHSQDEDNQEAFSSTYSIKNEKDRISRILITSNQRTASDELGAIISLSELQKQGVCVFKYKNENVLTFEDIAWCDILFIVRGLSYINLWAAKQAKKHGRIVLGYWDDNLLDIPKYSLSYGYFSTPEIKRNINSLFKFTDVFLSPSPKLASKLSSNYNAVTKVLPQPATPTIPQRINNRLPIVGFAGSLDHIKILNSFIDPVIHSVIGKTIDFELQIMGPKPDFLGKLSVENIHIPYISNYYDYIFFSARLGWNIGLAPQVDSEFTPYKYHTKLLEYTHIGCAGIYSKLEPYTNVIQNNITGLLVDNEVEAWKEAILKLLKDKELTYKIACNAYEYVNSHNNRKVVAEQYADALKSFLDYKAPKISKLYIIPAKITGRFTFVYRGVFIRLFRDSMKYIKTYGLARFIIRAVKYIASGGR